MAQLAPFSLVAPGSLGLNKEQENSILDYRWSTEARNLVLDKSGRLGVRKGWTTQTTNKVASSPAITAMGEWIKGDGTKQMIVATATKMFKDIDDFTDTGNDITPSSAPTAGNWKFLNFNGKVVGVQRSHAAAVYSGTDDFSYITGAPDGGIGLSAFGRLWIVEEDRQTIKYCGLLDETDWDGTGAGSIDMRNVWTQGMDEVTAIAALGATLIVFGRNHIVFWADGSGSELGLNPVNMAVVDTIEGTGCIARDSVQAIGEGDLVYLSQHGVQSLARVIQSKSNPLETLTKNIKGYLQELVDEVGDLDEVRSVFSAERGLYVLTLPDADVSIVLNMRKLFRDQDGHLVAVVTEWVHPTTPTAWSARENGDLLMGFLGEVGKYDTGNDGGTEFSVMWRTGWLDLGEQVQSVLKILKELGTKVTLEGDASIRWTWQYDFGGQEHTKIAEYEQGAVAEWNEAEWGEDEFSGGSATLSRTMDGSGEGQFIKVGLDMSAANAGFLLQQVTPYFKLGRMV